MTTTFASMPGDIGWLPDSKRGSTWGCPGHRNNAGRAVNRRVRLLLTRVGCLILIIPAFLALRGFCGTRNFVPGVFLPLLPSDSVQHDLQHRSLIPTPREENLGNKRKPMHRVYLPPFCANVRLVYWFNWLIWRDPSEARLLDNNRGETGYCHECHDSYAPSGVPGSVPWGLRFTGGTP